MNLSQSQIAECKGLSNWVCNVPEKEVDAVIEWLMDAGLLNREGKRFARNYWMHVWCNDKDPNEGAKR